MLTLVLLHHPTTMENIHFFYIELRDLAQVSVLVNLALLDERLAKACLGPSLGYDTVPVLLDS